MEYNDNYSDKCDCDLCMGVNREAYEGMKDEYAEAGSGKTSKVVQMTWEQITEKRLKIGDELRLIALELQAIELHKKERRLGAQLRKLNKVVYY